MTCLLAALNAEVEEKGEAGEVLLRFEFAGAALDEAIERLGSPPSAALHRRAPRAGGTRSGRLPDDVRGRTGRCRGADRGTPFHPLAGRADFGAGRAALHRVTLHVGAGTFLPVKAEDTRDHEMHAEEGAIDEATAEALNAARESGGRIVCVGTTSARLVESAADESGRIRPFAGETSIFITPGYRFRAVDALLTNFHLPRSTLFMLVSAFSGLERMRAAYAHAIEAGYRFYSYGDACLLIGGPETKIGRRHD